MNFSAPAIEWLPLIPMLVVFGAGALGILVEAFVRSPATRRIAQVQLSVAALLVALVAAIAQWASVSGPGTVVIRSMISVDRQALAWHVLILVFGILGVLLFADRTRAGETAFTPLASAAPGSAEESLARRKGLELTEAYPLVLFAIGGMMLFASVTDLIFLFVALEVFSLPLYLMVALSRRRRLLSQEAAMKYFLLGAFASAVYLFGAALLFGATGQTGFHELGRAFAVIGGRDPMVLLAIVMILTGLLFKLGAVPFHQWTPDVYVGAPTPVTAFMAAATKSAAAAALVRLAITALYRYEWELNWVVWTVAIASMVLGTVVALRQTEIKRMLAYSSIAHAGFVLVALAGFTGDALSAVPFYMLTYGLATLGAFAVVTQVRERSEDGALGAEATRLGQWAGLGKRSPLLAGSMALFMLSFAGIPLTAGFVGKFVAFRAALSEGAWPLVVVAVLASAAAAFFYVRLIVLMFFTDAPEDVEQAVSAEPTGLGRFVVVVAAALTVLLGVLPGWALSVAANAGTVIVQGTS